MARCDKCGAGMKYLSEYDSWYCPNCDEYYQMEEQPQQETVNHYRDRRSSSVKVLAVVFVVIMIIASSVTYFFFFYENSSDERDVPEITIQDAGEIRSLEPREDVPYDFMTEDELEDYVNSSLNNQALEETRLIFDALFLYDYDRNLSKEFAKTYSSDVLGFYNTNSKEMVIIEGYPEMLTKLTLIHEFTHALQDQHFDMSKMTQFTNSDNELARRSVVEGDATLVQIHYIQGLPEYQQEQLYDEINDMDDQGMPYALDRVMMFPYNQGYYFVNQIYMDGGWEAVNSLYTEIPDSTEQIMHIEKYRSDEQPDEVHWHGDVSGMDLVVNDTMGEYMVQTMLARYLSEGESSDAAAGWGGDRLYYYKGGGDFLSVFKIRWDSGTEANEFYTTWQQWKSELPSSFQDEINHGKLRIQIDGSETTIYFSNESSIIDTAMGQAS